MLKQKYFLTGIFILSAERQPIKLAWRKIVWLPIPVVYYNQIKATIFLYIVKRKYICGWILMVALFSERYGYIKVIVITG